MPKPKTSNDNRASTMLSGDIVVKGKVMFYNEDTRYAIVKAVSPAKDPNKIFTFKGILDHPCDGAAYHVQGYMEFDESRQEHYFKIKHSELKENKSTQGWVEYLQREGPNVGDMRANQLVQLYGEQVIQGLANDPDKALQISGLTPDRLKELSEWAKDEVLLASTKQMLYTIQLTPGLVRRIVMKFGRDTTRVIKTDPFLTMEIDGVGFVTATKIAEKVGCPHDSPNRVKYGILHVMAEHCEEGHTCIVWDRLVEKAQRLLGVGRDLIITVMKDLIAKDLLCTNHTPPRKFAKNKELFPDV